MKHKIIQINKSTCEGVCLNLTKNDEQITLVQITAWHYDSVNETEYLQEEFVEFPTHELCERYVADFSEKSAQAFVSTFVF